MIATAQRSRFLDDDTSHITLVSAAEPVPADWGIADLPVVDDHDVGKSFSTKQSTFTQSAHYEARHAPKGGISIGGQKFKGGQFIPAEVVAQATPAEKARLTGKPGGGQKPRQTPPERPEKPAGGKPASKPAQDKPSSKPKPLPQWDGTVDENIDTVAPDERVAERLQRFRTVNRHGVPEQNQVVLVHGEYDPFPDVSGSPIRDVWRWEARDDAGNELEVGEWTADRQQAIEDGNSYASDNNEDLPDWDGTIDDDAVDRDWRDRELTRSWNHVDDDNNVWEQNIYVVPGTYDPYPDDLDSEAQDVWRWEERDSSNSETAVGDWSTDRDQVVAEVNERADEQDMPLPEEEEEEAEPVEDELDNLQAIVPAQAPPYERERLPVSQASVSLERGVSRQEVLDQLRKLFPQAFHTGTSAEQEKAAYQALASLAGMPDDGRVTVLRVGEDDDVPGSWGLRVDGFHTHLDSAERFIGVDSQGRRYIHNLLLETADSAPKGVGLELFTRQVDNATAHGFDYIATWAAGGFGGGMNGYYTWPLFGYDQTIATLKVYQGSLGQKVAALFPDAETVQDIFDAPEVNLPPEEANNIRTKLSEFDKKRGRPERKREKITGADWWLVHGQSLNEARFDLRENSWAQYKLAKYLQKRKGGA